MDQKEIAMFLKLISSIWPNHRIDADLIKGWAILLDDMNFSNCVAALKASLKLGRLPRDFPPSLPALIEIIGPQTLDPREEARLQYKAAERSDLGNRAWEMWGGGRHWGMLPDPRYADDQEAAIKTLAFEERRYIDIYLSIAHKTENQRFEELSHEESKTILGKMLPGLEIKTI